MNYGRSIHLLVSAYVIALTSIVGAQDSPNPLIQGGKGKVNKVFEDIGLTFTLDSHDARVTAADANGLVHVFDVAMHAECDFFKASPCPRTVILSIVGADEFRCGSIDQQAACAFLDAADPSIRRIHVNAEYLAATSGYDVMAHEAMHLLQGSPDASDCDYWREGEADLARYYWGGSENHEASGFALPLPGYPWEAMLTDSTAAGAFLVWFNEKWGGDALRAFHVFMESHTCPGNEFWKAQTGFEDFDALWAAYAKAEPPATEDPGVDEEEPQVDEEQPEQPEDDGEHFEP